MNLLIPALVGGVIAMALALSFGPIETLVRARRYAKARALWLRRREARALALRRRLTRSLTSQTAPG